jgi:hypothetical protein
MVELARVPLAIAVRTQTSWNIKLAAAFGVASAVVVTSFSSSTIAYRTFDPRLGQANDTHNDLLKLEGQRPSLIAQIATLKNPVEQKKKNRDSIYAHVNNVTSQLTAQQGLNCGSITRPNPNPQGPPLTIRSCKENPVLKPLQAELAAENTKRTESEHALKEMQTNASHAENELVQFDARLGKAGADYRDKAVNAEIEASCRPCAPRPTSAKRRSVPSTRAVFTSHPNSFRPRSTRR